MVFSVLSALELDQRSAEKKFTLIEENNGSDGSFIISSFLEEAVKKNHKIVILLFHNSIGHYHAIAQKLGYNLSAYQEKGNVIVHDFFKHILNDSSNNEKVLKNLFLELKEQITEFQHLNDVTFLIENIGNLLSLDFPLKSIILFVHYCLILLHEFKNLSVICLIHNISKNDKFTVLLNNLRYKAHLNVFVDDLRTGRAVDISGKLRVQWRKNDLTEWEEANEYHYQLLDKNVNIFAPGTKFL